MYIPAAAMINCLAQCHNTVHTRIQDISSWCGGGGVVTEKKVLTWYISKHTKIFQGSSGRGVQHLPGEVQIFRGRGSNCIWKPIEIVIFLGDVRTPVSPQDPRVMLEPETPNCCLLHTYHIIVYTFVHHLKCSWHLNWSWHLLWS